MKKSIIATCAFLLLYGFLFSQADQNFVINAGGGNLQSGEICLTYFIGDHMGLGHSEFASTLIEIDVFPNPVKSILTLKIPADKFERIQVYNVSGVKVLDIKPTSNQLDFSNYPAGIYLIKVKDHQELEVGSIKVIKQ